MRQQNRINPHHLVHRTRLRACGFVLFAVGGVFMAIGLVSFFSAFGGYGPPKLFWCVFVGLPMVCFGTLMLKMGYLGSTARYVAGEVAPVASDTFNHLARETRDGVRDISSAVAEGLRGGAAAGPGVPCRGCGSDNDARARFCDQCGEPLDHPNTCGRCHKRNDEDARFCDGCGAPLG